MDAPIKLFDFEVSTDLSIETSECIVPVKSFYVFYIKMITKEISKLTYVRGLLVIGCVALANPAKTD